MSTLIIHTYVIVFLLLFQLCQVFSLQSPSFLENANDECEVESEEWAEDLPHASGPLISCDKLSVEWFECQDVTELIADNFTRSSTVCPYFGEKNGVVARVNVTCRALSCIECLGSRQFWREVPCIKHNGYYFLTALIYSIFLGFVAIDRFYLGYSAIGIGKLLTLGGFGVWWIADVVLLLCGSLKPADDSDWQPWEPY